MRKSRRIREDLISEIEDLRLRLQEAEQALRAIDGGKDAFCSAPESTYVLAQKGAEQPNRVLVEPMSEGAATLTGDGAILSCNNHLAALLQLPLERLIGARLVSFVAPADRHLFLSSLEKGRCDCESDQLSVVTGAGEFVPVLASCCANGLSDGRNVRMVLTDLSQQRHHKEIVAASERLPRSLTEQAGEAIVVCNKRATIIQASRLVADVCAENLLLKRYLSLFETMLEGFCYCKMLYDHEGSPADFLYLEVNDAFGRVTGLENVEGKKVTEVIPEIRDSSPELFEIFGRVAATGQPEKLEIDFKPLSAWFSLSIYSTERDHVMVVFDDITARKETEAALVASEQRLAMALEGGRMGLWEWDTHTDRSVWNATEYQLLGLAVGEGREATATFFDRVHPEDLGPLSRILAEAVERGSSFHHEVRITRADNGEERWLAAAGRICRDAAGSPQKLLGVNYDITARKRAEEALKRANEDLERRVAERTEELSRYVRKLEKETAEHAQAVEALREKEQMLIQQSRQAAMGEMIGNIAHQWRQPLNALGLIIQKIELDFELGEFGQDSVEQTVANSTKLIQHMSRTIDDFRNFCRPEKAKAAFNVRDTVARTMSLMRETYQELGIDFEIVSTADPSIYGYRNEFSQVLLNLLSNAKDALVEREAMHPKVTIAVGAAGGSAVVTISDNAGGIPEAVLGRIFDPYFTTKGAQGTGVGLFMSRNIIEKNMGGRLLVRNTAEGAEFTVEV